MATALERFEAEFPANEQGSYLIQIVEATSEGERRSTTAGLVVPYSPEYKELEGGSDLLEGLAAITGGNVLSSPSEAFGPGATASTWSCAAGLVAGDGRRPPPAV